MGMSEEALKAWMKPRIIRSDKCLVIKEKYIALGPAEMYPLIPRQLVFELIKECRAAQVAINGMAPYVRDEKGPNGWRELQDYGYPKWSDCTHEPGWVNEALDYYENLFKTEWTDDSMRYKILLYGGPFLDFS